MDGSPGLDVLAQQAVMARATRLARAGRYTEAEELLLRGAGDRQHLPAELDLLARISAQVGRLNRAEELWSQAQRLDPYNLEYTAALRLIAKLKRPLVPPGQSRPSPIMATPIARVTGYVRWAVRHLGIARSRVRRRSSSPSGAGRSLAIDPQSSTDATGQAQQTHPQGGVEAGHGGSADRD